MSEIIEKILTVFVSSLGFGTSIGGIIYFFLRKRIRFYFAEKENRIKSEREAMSKFLQIWYERKSSKTDMDTLVKSVRETMLWCPNNVLYHIGM